MSDLPSPDLTLIVNGVDVSADMASDVLSFTYQDFHDGQADEVEVELRDDLGLLRGAWRPEHGDIVEAAIGYKNGGLLDCGRFEVDEPTASGSRGSGDTLTFRAIAAAPSKALRTKNTAAYENQNIEQIANKIAGKHGLSVVGEIDKVKFKRITQRQKRDLEFLSELAEDYGHYFTNKGNNLVFIKRESLESRPAVRTITRLEVTSYNLKDSTHKTYSKAKVQHLSSEKKKLITAEATDSSVKTGDTLNVAERVEDETQAKKLAEGRLAKANDEKRTCSITLVGDMLLVAGQVIALDASFGRWAGRYLVRTARHTIARGSGYSTEIEVKGLD